MAGENRVGAVPLAICWALTAAAFAARAVATAETVPLILDTDDAMRLNMVHDLLAGQGWFDLVQHRLNTPFGAMLHWSRLIDLPEAALLFVLRPIAGSAADAAAAYAWPLLLLGPLLWLTGKLALRLGGRIALWPALLLPAFSLVTMAEFAPGRLDHHSVQILMALAMLYGAMAALERPRFALAAGIAAGLALTIGIEALPIVGATTMAFGISWVTSERRAAALRDFGLSFALTTILGLAQGVAPDRWLTPGSDAISFTYALAATLCGGAFALLSIVPLRTAPLRLVAGLVAGGGVLTAVVLSYPTILGGPYGELDPWLLANWLAQISEAESWVDELCGRAGLRGSCGRARRNWSRGDRLEHRSTEGAPGGLACLRTDPCDRNGGDVAADPGGALCCAARDPGLCDPRRCSMAAHGGNARLCADPRHAGERRSLGRNRRRRARHDRARCIPRL